MTEGWMDGSENPGDRIAYRYQLKQLMTAAGYNTDFVGSESNGCNISGFTDCQNAGIGGTRDQYLETMLISGYDPRWGVQETTGPYLDAFQPDVIFLSIGTNDITHDGEMDEPNAIGNQRVSGILDQIDLYEGRSGKEVTVFLALIINRRKLVGGGDAPKAYTTSLWNQTIETMALQRIANGDNIVIVDMEHDAGFNYAYYGGDMWLNDPEGLHPSPTGYIKMANLWFQAFTANYNSAPVIDMIPNQTISEGGSFSTVQLDNYVSDVEDADQYITWTATQLNGSHLNITNLSNRQAIITPINANWNGSQTVVFTATDRGKSGLNIKSDADTVVFTVTAVNDPPTITAQSALAVNEDNSLSLSLSNFTVYDPDSDPSTFQLVILPGTNYTFNGNLVTPSLNYSGTLTVNAAVRDNVQQGSSYPAQITVNPVNDPPVYSGQSDISIDEDASYTINLQDFNISDPDNTINQLTLVMLPGLNYTIDGSVVRPDANYNGVLYIESYIRDPLEATSNNFYIQITVNPINDPPVFTSIPPDSIDLDLQYIYSIKVTDPDRDDVLTFTILLKPTWINFYPNSKLLAGIPHTGDSGNHGISIEVSDGHTNAIQSYVLHVDGATSIFENKSETALLYPNPAADHVVINMQNRAEELVLNLYDVSGRPVLQKIFCTDCDPILYFNDNQLAPGTYLYVISTSKETIRGKLLIIGK
jgi:lysophospholipase L1-like esterase